MDTFTVGTRRNWLFRALGPNPLVRQIDRIEAWSLVVAALVLAVATPFVGAFGTSVHDTRDRSYAQEAQHRHPVTATAIEEGELVVDFNDLWYVAEAQWNAAGEGHVGIVKWPDRVKIRDQQAIWVDDDGEYAQPPRPPSRATTDAWAIALSVWFALFCAVAGAQCAIRRRLDSLRFAQWDLEINKIAEGGDRKKSQ